ncbi:MAG: biotin-dependent carboxyltransferase family protein [Flavisolibacter sp.]|nr:biotin-dependent carboxyltransferase family protein [Flavisolibacter sp.]
MSLRIIKAGLLDTIQDCGRYGFQHLGINPNGAMDRFSAQLANVLLGKELAEPVLELHFPAAQIVFEKETILCITGGDFSPTLNGTPIPLHHPVMVAGNTVLQFQKAVYGSRCYISFLPELNLGKWMNSYSTNTKAATGGWQGRALQKGDVIHWKEGTDMTPLLQHKAFAVLHWTSHETVTIKNEIECIIGSEWHSLTKEAQSDFQSGFFQISNESDRMGYRLKGPDLAVTEKESLVSSGVSFGTVQLLPDGQLIILMADHQTTGGYPRVAHIASAHLPIVAQKKPGDVLRFTFIDLETAEQKFIEQQKYLHQLQTTCAFRMEEVIHASDRP